MTKRILLVDDDRDIANLYRMVLQIAGYEAVTAYSSEEALQEYSLAKHSTKKFDLIVMDLAMPFINGFELWERIKATGNDTPGVFLSADTFALDSGRAHESGVSDCWQKPIEARDFLFKVNELIGDAQAGDGG